MFSGRGPQRGSRPSILNSATLRTLCETCCALRDHNFKPSPTSPKEWSARLDGKMLLECAVCGTVRGLKQPSDVDGGAR